MLLPLSNVNSGLGTSDEQEEEKRKKYFTKNLIGKDLVKDKDD